MSTTAYKWRHFSGFVITFKTEIYQQLENIDPSIYSVRQISLISKKIRQLILIQSYLLNGFEVDILKRIVYFL
jgi:hypothetical protein